MGMIENSTHFEQIISIEYKQPFINNLAKDMVYFSTYFRYTTHPTY